MVEKLVWNKYNSDKVYDVLVERAGATETARESFNVFDPETQREFRFQGSLGFGGKVWYSRAGSRFFVNCYVEDMTPARAKVIDEVNRELETVSLEVFGGGNAKRHEACDN